MHPSLRFVAAARLPTLLSVLLCLACYGFMPATQAVGLPKSLVGKYVVDGKIQMLARKGRRKARVTDVLEAVEIKLSRSGIPAERVSVALEDGGRGSITIPRKITYEKVGGAYRFKGPWRATIKFDGRRVLLVGTINGSVDRSKRLTLRMKGQGRIRGVDLIIRMVTSGTKIR